MHISYTGLWVVLTSAIIIVCWRWRWPRSVLDISEIPAYVITDRHGRAWHHIRGSNNNRSHYYTDISQIPPFVIDAIVYREDRRFWDHRGIDMIAWVRAIYQRYKDESLTQWASTIDQQLVKLLLQHHSRNRWNKFQELRYALHINRYYEKSEILVAYLNHLEFGSLTQGLSLACQHFYATDCHNLSTHQLIYLLSQSKFPWLVDVSSYASGFAHRFAHDRPHMYQTDIFTDRNTVKWSYTVTPQLYPHLTDYILNTLKQNQFSDSIVAVSSGYVITSIDLNLVDQIQDILTQYRPYLVSQGSQDACVVVIQSGWIRSLNVARPRNDHQWGMVNPCTRPRQIWSTIKPFVYALALDILDLTWSSILQDQPTTFVLGDGGLYEPKNFDLVHHGSVTVRQALWSSLNLPAVWLLSRMWLDQFWSRRNYVTQKVHTDQIFNQNPAHYGLSLALGSIEVSPLDLARVYQILNPSYQWFFSNQHFLESIRAILSDNHARLLSFPLENRFDIPHTRVKSGTSRNFVDGRACGGVWDYTVCIRVWNYNAKPMKDSGYNTAGVLRHHVITLLRQKTT